MKKQVLLVMLLVLFFVAADSSDDCGPESVPESCVCIKRQVICDDSRHARVNVSEKSNEGRLDNSTKSQ
ncbi:hypothetical protein Trydic_g18221 [Trypoxylus dichotomus]